MYGQQPQVTMVKDPLYPSFDHYHTRDNFLIVVLAMLEAAHKGGLLLPEAEVIKAFRAMSAIHVFNTFVIPD